MTSPEPVFRPNHQTVLNRFVAACQSDTRVVAAFLGGSYARGKADAYSDLDLYLITGDEAFEDFVAGREAFMRQFGDLVFLEDFGLEGIVFYIFADDTEGELSFAPESRFRHIHGGPHKVLLDKKNILTEAVFPWHDSEQAEQLEKLCRQIYWFWHELSHFITAMGRGQLWWAYGQLEALRRICINLAHLQHNFAAHLETEAPYFKIEQTLPVETLSALQSTFCPMEAGAMLKAGLAIVEFYKELAPPLAWTHGVPYPDALEGVMSDRLEKLRNTFMS